MANTPFHASTTIASKHSYSCYRKLHRSLLTPNSCINFCGPCVITHCEPYYVVLVSETTENIPTLTVLTVSVQFSIWMNCWSWTPHRDIVLCVQNCLALLSQMTAFIDAPFLATSLNLTLRHYLHPSYFTSTWLSVFSYLFSPNEGITLCYLLRTLTLYSFIKFAVTTHSHRS